MSLRALGLMGGWAMLGMLALQGPHFHRGYPPHVTAPPRLVLNVSPDEASVQLPVDHRSYWWWNLGQTKEGALEYLWMIELPPDQQTAFGISHFKSGAQQPTSGTLAQLVNASKKGVWSLEGSRRRLIAGMKPSATVVDDSVIVLRIRDVPTLQLLFTAQPQEAWFVEQIPGRGETRTPVRIAYTRPNE